MALARAMGNRGLHEPYSVAFGWIISPSPEDGRLLGPPEYLRDHIQCRRAWSKKSKIFVMFSGLRQMTVM